MDKTFSAESTPDIKRLHGLWEEMLEKSCECHARIMEAGYSSDEARGIMLTAMREGKGTVTIPVRHS